MLLKVVSLGAALVAAVSAQWQGYSDCQNCIRNGFTWQEQARRCTRNCDIQDISCARVLSQCPYNPNPRPPTPTYENYKNCRDCTIVGYKWSAGRCFVSCAQDTACYTEPQQCPSRPPPSRPCDCYVDLNKVGNYGFNYINMWSPRPCGQSLGALYQGRCLFYANGSNPGKRRRANCGGGTFSYIRLITSSGKSTGWVAERFLVCRQNNRPPPPPPAPAPPAAQASLPRAPSGSDDSA